MTTRHAFGPRLQRTREQLGLSRSAIAEATKINPWLLTELERGDLTHWPRGLVRRSFLRQYAAALRIPADPLLEEIARLYPEPGQEPPPDDGVRLRITAGPESRWPLRARRALAAALDSGAVLLAGVGLAALSDVNLWTMTAGVALSYFAASTLVLGQSLASWALPATRAAWDRDPMAGQHWLSDALKAAPVARTSDSA